MSAATMHEFGSSRCRTIVRMYPCSDAAIPGGTTGFVASVFSSELPTRSLGAPPSLAAAALLPPAAALPLLPSRLSALANPPLLVVRDPCGEVLEAGWFSRIASSIACLPRTSSRSLHATASTTAVHDPGIASCCDCCSRRRKSLSVVADVFRRRWLAADGDGDSPAKPPSWCMPKRPPPLESAAEAVRLRRKPASGDSDTEGDEELDWVPRDDASVDSVLPLADAPDALDPTG